MSEPITIGYGANKWIKDADTKVVALWLPYMGNGNKSLKKQGTYTDYQVPVGKKFIILVVNNTYTNTTFYKAATLNATTLPVMQVGLVDQYQCYVEIPAGHYVTIGYLSSSNHIVSCLGVECNA